MTLSDSPNKSRHQVGEDKATPIPIQVELSRGTYSTQDSWSCRKRFLVLIATSFFLIHSTRGRSASGQFPFKAVEASECVKDSNNSSIGLNGCTIGSSESHAERCFASPYASKKSLMGCPGAFSLSWKWMTLIIPINLTKVARNSNSRSFLSSTCLLGSSGGKSSLIAFSSAMKSPVIVFKPDTVHCCSASSRGGFLVWFSRPSMKQAQALSKRLEASCCAAEADTGWMSEGMIPEKSSKSTIH